MTLFFRLHLFAVCNASDLIGFRHFHPLVYGFDIPYPHILAHTHMHKMVSRQTIRHGAHNIALSIYLYIYIFSSPIHSNRQWQQKSWAFNSLSLMACYVGTFVCAYGMPNLHHARITWAITHRFCFSVSPSSLVRVTPSNSVPIFCNWIDTRPFFQFFSHQTHVWWASNAHRQTHQSVQSKSIWKESMFIIIIIIKKSTKQALTGIWWCVQCMDAGQDHGNLLFVACRSCRLFSFTFNWTQATNSKWFFSNHEIRAIGIAGANKHYYADWKIHGIPFTLDFLLSHFFCAMIMGKKGNKCSSSLRIGENFMLHRFENSTRIFKMI